jgi:hypothetical protein
MRTKLAIAVVLFISAIVPALPAQAHIFHRFAACRGCAYGSNDGQSSSGEGAAGESGAWQTGWHGGYYDVAWGMPMALVVPPTARWQTDYSWGVPSMRMSPINANFQYQNPGPSSSYKMGQYPPALAQPSDTQQMGDYHVRGPGGRR